ncbi:MAG TPA: SRPBCC family protein [Chthoniobacterales bacterium]|nr:SRPBCC family protein [Chthoniobacterales bacterium]
MPKIFYSVAIPSSIERVWSIIRDFNDFPSWHPEVYDSSIEDNRLSDAVGCVRSRLRLLEGEIQAVAVDFTIV